MNSRGWFHLFLFRREGLWVGNACGGFLPTDREADVVVCSKHFAIVVEE